jgi:site-specific DNA-methyltransferase (adenine-specific)
MRLCLAPKSIHTVVTSPPYFGLRNYDHDGQLGQEQTPEEYVAALVAVFDEVWRVLRDDGTVWLNLGDSYARNPAKGTPNGRNLAKMGYSGGAGIPVGIKEKELIGIPWMVAFALRAAGWYLRQDIIWAKSNPMPESVTDRCTKAHEYIFLLTKSARYYFDGDAIAEPAVSTHSSGNGFAGRQGGAAHMPMSGGRGTIEEWKPGGTRNKRSVWMVPSRPYKGAHFATFPPDLIAPCILAGSPRGGGCAGSVRRRRHHRSGQSTAGPLQRYIRYQRGLLRNGRSAAGGR